MPKRNWTEYNAAKKRMFVRDGYKCRHCRSRENVTPHHMVLRSQGGKDVVENLLCLCIKCHNAIHDGFLTIAWGEQSGNGPVQFTREKGYRV